MRILIIEDYKPLQKALTQGLKESGFAVDATGDGEEGLWYAESNDYDVIILDLMLPGKDGWQILRALRQQGKEVPVLILTARSDVEERVKGLDLGADDYLVKPFAFEELLARVRALLRRAYQRKNPLIRIADLSIDTARKEVRRGSKLIELTPREYALLEYLAFRQGEVVTRTEIWEHVYDFHSEATSNVVDVYIGYLRRKIDKDFHPPVIHTRRGIGYYLGIQEEEKEKK
ncbi:MAG: response regulator [Candidatus Sumerlaeia bacterium]|nr:response regulator [Candidatus Sumerlaeia bacterium]